MRVKLIVVGKTAFQYLKEGEDIYEKRLQHYCNYERIDIPDLKNLKLFSLSFQITILLYYWMNMEINQPH